MSTAILSIRVNSGPTPIFEGVRARAAAPFAGEAGKAAVAIMRHGPGSTEEQFAVGAEFTRNGQHAWPPTKPFGNREPPASRLVRSGGLRAAWTGTGAGAVERVTATSVAIGVSTSVHPQAAIFQKDGPTLIRAKRRTANGRLAMQFFLGLTYDVWISQEKLLAGLRVDPRRVGIGRVMIRRLTDSTLAYIATGRLRAA